MGSMIDRIEFENLNKDQIQEQIEIREKLLGELVGWLYPRIVRDEIHNLHNLLLNTDLKTKESVEEDWITFKAP